MIIIRSLIIMTLLFAPIAHANITFQINVTDDPGEGFNDSIWGADRFNAFQFASDIWGSLLQESYIGETIVIDASMDPMGGGSFGSSSTNYLWPGWNNTLYGDALANHLAGYDLNDQSTGVVNTAEIIARFNSDVNWYYGVDGNAGSNIDFVTVVLHEIGHGLNLFDLIQQDGSFFTADTPGIYDRFLVNSSGTALTSMNQAERAASIVSNDLFWNGINGTAANGDVFPELFAPSSYQLGSSVSHLDETLFTNELMSPYYSGVDHTPGDISLGMLQDMGWNSTFISEIPEPSTLALMFIALIGIRLGRIQLKYQI